MRIVVVGAGWSGLAAATFLREKGHTVHVHEAAPRPGGRIRSLREDGYLVEAGPHGVVPGPATRRLLEIGKVPLDEAPPGAPRFVAHRGRAHALPAKPPQLLATKLLTPAAKARLLAEPLHKAGPPGETVGAFARRRLGRGVAHLADAFVTGVYAGDPDRLVLEHAFPQMRRMDQQGGLLRNATRPPQGPRPRLAAPRDGVESLVRALADRLDVAYGEPVLDVRETAEGVEVRTPRGAIAADRAILAVDPAALQRTLGVPAPPPPVAPVHVVAFGVPRDAAPPEGYGILAPEREGRFVLGALYESRLFPGRAPPGHELVRCLVGGRRHPERAALPLDEIARRAWDDIKDLGVVRGSPARVFHLPTEGIPQPEQGHDAWLAALPRGRIRALGIGHRAVGLDALATEASLLAEELA